jgi:hypothetical protein
MTVTRVPKTMFAPEGRVQELQSPIVAQHDAFRDLLTRILMDSARTWIATMGTRRSIPALKRYATMGSTTIVMD